LRRFGAYRLACTCTQKFEQRKLTPERFEIKEENIGASESGACVGNLQRVYNGEMGQARGGVLMNQKFAILDCPATLKAHAFLANKEPTESYD